MSLINKIRRRLGRYRAEERMRNYCTSKDGAFLAKRDFPELTEEEWNECKEAWHSIKLKKEDMTWARIWKAEHGFSPYFIGLFQCVAIRKALNPKTELHAFDNKALCDVYFPEMQFAESYVRRIKGVLYDKGMTRLSFEDASRILMTKRVFFIKPALDSREGTGVEKITLSGEPLSDVENIRRAFERQKGDFIAQEPLRQNIEVASLNPTSVNCCRITTIYIDGRFSSASTLKIGRKGADRDNWNVSYFVKVSDDGTLADFGYDHDLNRVQYTDNGTKIGGFKVPMFGEMVAAVEKYHKKYFPNCGMIGWDVITDDNNHVRLIEMNVTMPGFLIEQLCCGPFFEPFAKEINDRISKTK